MRKKPSAGSIGLQGLAPGELVLKGFHLIDGGKVPGWLLLIDPEDLSIDVRQRAAVSSARLTIQQSATGRQVASVELAATLPTIGTIFPGMNDDVFILSSEAGGKSGLITRIAMQ